MPTKNIVFLDSQVSGFEKLLAGLGPDTKWFLLDAHQDGVHQMQHVLANYAELDSIHVISHGATGALYLGSTLLTAKNLNDYTPQLQSIGSSLTKTGDILLMAAMWRREIMATALLMT